MQSLITTSDGSHTIKDDATGDTYHSIHGALQESDHIYIRNGLEYFHLSFPQRRTIRILEIGFGTGLNAMLSWSFAEQHGIELEYLGIEKFPLSPELYRQLNYDLAGNKLIQLHQCDWQKEVKVSPEFRFTKQCSDVQEAQIPFGAFDVIYYDAFAPKSQPELWTREMLTRVRHGMGRPSVLVSYCVKGTVKRNLKELGLTIETPNGPPGKRSILRASQF